MDNEKRDDDTFCNYCDGDEALFYKNNDNCAFVDSKGRVLVCANGESMEFQVKYCPACGKEFILKQEKTRPSLYICRRGFC